jgi:anti-sigma factor RsiW
MSDHDAELVALIDNELDEGSRTALLARLAADDGLRRRYQELRQTSVPLAASFGALLEQAPLARLRAALPAGEPIRPSLRRFAGIAFRELAAGLVIGARSGHRPMGRIDPWAVRGAGRLAHGDRRIHTSLHE